MARVRNNQGHRNKIANVFIRPYIEQENTQEREAYLQARETVKPLQDKTWQLASTMVRKHYTPEDIKMAYHLQNKFENVDTIAKDSCFHFGYQGQEESRDNNDKPIMKDKYIESHFDFKLNGNINGQENGRQNDFAYAYFRDELKGKVNKGDKCNPDINIEQKWGDGSGEENKSNPHWTQVDQANERELGLSGGKENQTSYSREWNNDYELDLIGREYCRDRSIACTEQEFKILVAWKEEKGQFIMAHYKYIKSVLDQMKEIFYLGEGMQITDKVRKEISDLLEKGFKPNLKSKGKPRAFNNGGAVMKGRGPKFKGTT